MFTQMKRLFFIGLSVLLLAGCATARASTPAPAANLGTNPFAVQAGDNSLTTDTVTFVSAEVKNVGGSPAQVDLNIAYRLPTPCHQLRVIVTPPDSTGRINIKMYSLMKPNTPCALMALATPLQATWTLGTFPAGHYTIYINDAKAVEFDA